MQMLNISISHETVRDIVIKAGIKITEKENEEIKLNQKEKLVAGTKEIPVLFEEADGLWINLQGKDRKEQIEKYKLSCKKSLVNKMYITGFMSSSELKKRRDTKIYQKYDVSKIKLRVLNGDGASWISQLATKETIQQRDNFHIHQEIMRDIQEDEHRRQLERLIAEKRYDEVPVYLEYLRYELRR